MKSRLFGVALTVLISACASGGQPSRDQSAQLVVDNRGYPDMVIYAVDGTRRIRIGTATGNLTTKLRIPPTVVQTGREVRFVADPIGSDRAGMSEEIFVRPGQQVTLIIPP
ncbi:MAG: hypothetical protein ACRENU_15955 [Gemmatimonadaceae bacterium]